MISLPFFVLGILPEVYPTLCIIFENTLTSYFKEGRQCCEVDGGDPYGLQGPQGTMARVCALTIPTHTDIFLLHADASGAGIGTTFNINWAGVDMPVAYFGHQLQGPRKDIQQLN